MALSAWDKALQEEVPDGKPWDDRPPTDAQIGCAQELVRRLHEEADWSRLVWVGMTDTLKALYGIHKRLGLEWRDIVGTDPGRYV